MSKINLSDFKLGLFAFIAWMRKFLGRHRPAAVGFVLLSLVVGVALFGPLFVGDAMEVHQHVDGEQGMGLLTWQHPLGLDKQGYGVFTRLVYGARTTTLVALAATLLSLVLGSLTGAVAGFAGGWVDAILMRLVDLAMSLPGFLLALVMVAIFREQPALEAYQFEVVIFAVGFVGAPLFARQVRAEVLRVQSQEFVAAAMALGYRPGRILFRHVLPNSIGPIIVLGTLGMGTAILDVAGLNFLGLGGDPYEVPEWGLTLAQGWQDRPLANTQVAAAGICIFISVLGFNLLGDGLKDELDPRSRRGTVQL